MPLRVHSFLQAHAIWRFAQTLKAMVLSFLMLEMRLWISKDLIVFHDATRRLPGGMWKQVSTPGYLPPTTEGAKTPNPQRGSAGLASAPSDIIVIRANARLNTERLAKEISSHQCTHPSHILVEHGHPRMSERIVNQIAPIIDALFPLILEEIVEVVKSISHVRIQQRIM